MGLELQNNLHKEHLVLCEWEWLLGKLWYAGDNLQQNESSHTCRNLEVTLILPTHSLSKKNHASASYDSVA